MNSPKDDACFAEASPCKMTADIAAVGAARQDDSAKEGSSACRALAEQLSALSAAGIRRVWLRPDLYAEFLAYRNEQRLAVDLTPHPLDREWMPFHSLIVLPRQDGPARRDTPCGLTEPSPPDLVEWSMSLIWSVKPYNDRGRDAFLALVPDRYKRP